MIKKAYNRIYKKLEGNAALRQNDKLLCLSVWEDEGLYLSTSQQRKFMEVSSPETIRRTRQKVQEDGYFRLPEKTRTMRKVRQSEVKAEVMHDRMVQSEMFAAGKRFPA